MILGDYKNTLQVIKVRPTTIKISKTNKFELSKLKLTPRETYDEVISRLLELADIPSDFLDFELYNDTFKINCEADFESDHWYFLDQLGGQSEFLKATESFVAEEIQKKYEEFIEAINTICQADLNLLDYGAGLAVGETHEFQGFTMKRTA